MGLLKQMIGYCMVFAGVLIALGLSWAFEDYVDSNIPNK
jgi:hypothetical protein